MRAFAPNGSPIIGTLESVPAVALILPGTFGLRTDGAVTFERAMEVRLYQDRRQTVWRNDQPIYVAEDGTEVPQDQLVFKEEEVSR